jgi:hypothetical protein
MNDELILKMQESVEKEAQLLIDGLLACLYVIKHGNQKARLESIMSLNNFFNQVEVKLE